MPWNFPFWQLFPLRGAGIVAGNVALLKHASNVVRRGAALEELWHDAGAPPGVFQTLLVPAAAVAAVVADERVRAVTLTGSSAPA
jgi:succinate-semialdehyde dehydrogenase/glutarate-semialdehyde dehydrogenase